MHHITKITIKRITSIIKRYNFKSHSLSVKRFIFHLFYEKLKEKQFLINNDIVSAFLIVSDLIIRYSGSCS